MNDAEEADNMRQAFSSGDVSGFVDAIRRATTPPGLSLKKSNNSSKDRNASVASAEAVSSSSDSSTVLVTPTPFSVLFTSVDGTSLATTTTSSASSSDAGGREVVTDGYVEPKKLSGGAVAGIVIGSVAGVVGIVAVALAVVAGVRRRNGKQALGVGVGGGRRGVGGGGV